MVEIYAINQKNRLDTNTFNELISMVSDSKRKRINRFMRWEDSQRSLVGDVLVRFVLSKKYGLQNHEISFTKNKYGKPSLKNNHNISFNISHAGSWVVCAVSNFNVGIDVEKIKATDFDIAKRFFAADEYNHIMSQPGEEERINAFYDLWTLKESYIKATGEGLYKSLDEFSITITNNSYYLQDPAGAERFRFKQYSIDKQYKLSLCVSEKTFNDNLTIISINDFINSLTERFEVSAIA